MTSRVSQVGWFSTSVLRQKEPCQSHRLRIATILIRNQNVKALPEQKELNSEIGVMRSLSFQPCIFLSGFRQLWEWVI